MKQQTKIETVLQWGKELFTLEGQNKRFSIELNEVFEQCTQEKYELHFVQNTNTKRWIEIEISIPSNVEMQVGNEFQNVNQIVFVIQIGKEYPVKDVRVVCRTTFVRPTLADGRNILGDIILQPWNYKQCLLQIVRQIPTFLERIIQNRFEKIHLQNIGQYYLGSQYSIEELKEYPELARFPVIQQQNAFFQNISVRLICLSEAHFYLFDVIEGKDDLRLIFRSPLQSCIQLKRKRDQQQEIQLTWKNYKTKQEEIQLFTINEYDKFIRLFLKRLNQYQHIRMTSNSYLIFGDTQQAEKQKITSIIRNLHQLENEIEKKFNQQTINKLMDLYQQAIEFYSSASDYLYEIYLNKLQTLIQRQDVQVILQYKQQ